MARKVQCVVLKREAEGLDFNPYPGELGQRIYDNVSAEGWKLWLQRLAAIMNENGLSTADPRSFPVVEKGMLGFFFGEGEGGQLPQGYKPN